MPQDARVTAATDDPDSSDLSKALLLEQLDVNLFRSRRLWRPAPGARAVFGGQIIGQSLVAAHAAVDDQQLHIHSMHSYFLLPGDNTVPALYHVDRIRDGKSFATRQVTAKQRGRAIFSALVSFHRDEQSLLNFEDAMPDAPPPEELPTRQQNWRRLIEQHGRRMPEGMRQYVEARINAPFPLDMRNCDPTLDVRMLSLSDEGRRVPRAPRQRLWFRSVQPLGRKPAAHACVAAYASDYALVGTATLAAPRAWAMAASLDHSMWFHAPFRADEWMLYDLAASRARGARALITGRLFKRDGALAVTIAQEGLLRFQQQGGAAAAALPAAGAARPPPPAAL